MLNPIVKALRESKEPEEAKPVNESEVSVDVCPEGGINVKIETPEENVEHAGPEGVENTQVVEPVEPEAEPTEDSVTVDVDDTFEEGVVRTEIPEDDPILKIVSKVYKSYDDLEKVLVAAKYMVTDVFRENDGFNLNAYKDGVEYFIPFIPCEGGYCAILHKEQLEEGIGDIFRNIGAKINKAVATMATKGGAEQAIDAFMDTMKATYPNFELKRDADGIAFNPKSGYVAKILCSATGEGLKVTGVMNSAGQTAACDSLEQAGEILAKNLGVVGDSAAAEEAATDIASDAGTSEGGGGETPPAATGSDEEEDDEDTKKAIETLKAKGWSLDKIKQKLGIEDV